MPIPCDTPESSGNEGSLKKRARIASPPPTGSMFPPKTPGMSKDSEPRDRKSPEKFRRITDNRQLRRSARLLQRKQSSSSNAPWLSSNRTRNAKPPLTRQIQPQRGPEVPTRNMHSNRNIVQQTTPGSQSATSSPGESAIKKI